MALGLDNKEADQVLNPLELAREIDKQDSEG
jgi:hypothetical protein